MRRIKELFDPHSLLNPGKVVSDSTQRVSDHLRPWMLHVDVRSSINEMNDENAQVGTTPKESTLNWIPLPPR